MYTHQTPNPRSPQAPIGTPATHQQISLPEFSAASITNTLLSPIGPPPSLPLTPPRRQPPRREGEVVIGHVLADKRKFRCSKHECHNSTFGRLADLRRHYEASHGPPNRAEYYCPIRGCQRSRHFGGGGGRSFGTRKDKCEEHIRNVHKDVNEDHRGHAQQYSPSQESDNDD